jgi:hypothetical protein
MIYSPEELNKLGELHTGIFPLTYVTIVFHSFLLLSSKENFDYDNIDN